MCTCPPPVLTEVFSCSYRANWCIVHGTKYKKGAVVHTGSDGIMPEFAEIKNIVTVPAKSEQVFLTLKPIITVAYENHAHAYKVRTSGDRGTVVEAQTELLSFRPLHIQKINGNKYVCPKHDLDVYSENI